VDPLSARAVRQAYETVAADYVVAFGDDLDRLPLDRELLDLALAGATGDGCVLEAGCGPAPAASYYGARVPDPVGIDLSAAMLAQARARRSTIATAQGDLRRLPLRAGTCRLAIAFYSLQHMPRADLGEALAELHRVLAPDGRLLLAMHLGEGDVETSVFLGHEIDTVGGVLYGRDELLERVRGAGFDVELERERGPLPHEHDTQRLYLIARRAG
jgi:SAM-dependent methyltransferase